MILQSVQLLDLRKTGMVAYKHAANTSWGHNSSPAAVLVVHRLLEGKDRTSVGGFSKWDVNSESRNYGAQVVQT